MLYIPQATMTKQMVNKFIVREYIFVPTCAFCKIFQMLNAWKDRQNVNKSKIKLQSKICAIERNE